jgi:hypothetical protein
MICAPSLSCRFRAFEIAQCDAATLAGVFAIPPRREISACVGCGGRSTPAATMEILPLGSDAITLLSISEGIRPWQDHKEIAVRLATGTVVFGRAFARHGLSASR